MDEILLNVNWLAVIVGAVVAFLVGWLWYSPMLFGKKWAGDHKIEMGTAGDMPFVAMATQAIGLFLVAWFVGVTAVGSQLLTFILAAVGFGILNASGSLFAKKSNAIAWIDFGYLIAAVFVMFLAQALL